MIFLPLDIIIKTLIFYIMLAAEMELYFHEIYISKSDPFCVSANL